MADATGHAFHAMPSAFHAMPPIPQVAAPWSVFAAEAPDLADRISARFDPGRRHVLATYTIAGTPRVSGIEVGLLDGRLATASTRTSRKGEDLRRDARFALHSNPGDGSRRDGDATLQGRAVPMARAQAGALPRVYGDTDTAATEGFWLDLTGARLTRVVGGVLRVETWRPGRAIETVDHR